MGLGFIIGRSGSGKSYAILEDMAKKQKNQPNETLILIVPEQYSLQAERDLSRHTGSGILGATVLSFGRLAHRVFGECGTDRRRVMTDRSKAMVLKKVLIDKEESLQYYRRSANKNGFLEMLSTTVSECYRYGLSPASLETMVAQAPKDSVLLQKLSDLHCILSTYDAYLKEGYLSADETLDILAACANQSAFLKGAEIWLDGFYGFTPQEYKVIAKLIGLCKQVTVTLTMDEESFYAPNLSETAPFYEPWDTARRLQTLARQLGAQEKNPLILKENHRHATRELQCLEAGYFGRQVFAGEGSVRIASAESRYREVEAAACEVVRLVREEGCRYRDIALMTRALEDYGKIVPAVFARHRIPCFVDSRQEVLSHPLMELVRAGILTLARDFAYEPLFRFLKTGLGPLNAEETDCLENYVLAYGAHGYRFYRYPWTAGFATEEEGDEMNALKARVLAPFTIAFGENGRAKKQKVSDLCRQVYLWLTAMEVPAKLETWIESADQKTASFHRQSWGILMEVLESLEEVLGQEEVTAEAFAKLLDAGLGSSSLGLLPSGVDQVIIGDLERTRFPEIRALLVLGVNDGILPSAGEAVGLFSQTERENLLSMGAELAHDGSRLAFEEEYLIYCGLTKPREFLYLSYAKGDLSGKAMEPSSLIQRLETMFPGCRQEMRHGPEEISVDKAALRDLAARLRRTLEGETLPPHWQDALSYYLSQEGWKATRERVFRGLTNRHQEPSLSEQAVSMLYGETLFSSVSRLERYVSCPYAYFTEYGLKAKPRKEYALGAPDLGSLFHEVLEWISRRIREEGKDWRSLEEEALSALVEEGIDTLAPDLISGLLLSSASGCYLIRRLKRVLKRAVWALAEHIRAGTFEPLGYEIGFGREAAMPPIRIGLPDGRHMELSGKIDRVDILETDGTRYVKIIDYKSSRKAYQLQDVYYGLQLQLLLYMDAFLKQGQAMLGQGPLLPGGVFYFRITDPLLKAKKPLEEETRELARLKELRLSGLALAEGAVLLGLDQGLADASYTSPVVPVATNKEGLPKQDGGAIALEHYEALLSYVAEKTAAVGASILAGEIPVRPAKNNGRTPCEYCKYHGICGFDTAYADCRVQNLRKQSEQELWTKIFEMRNENDTI